MKVLLVGEGAHEGTPGEDGDERQGALKEIVRRLNDQLEVQRFEYVKTIKRLPRKRKAGAMGLHGKGMYGMAMQWVLYAEENGYDALIFVVDQDKDTERSKQLTQAQEETAVGLPRALGVAIRAFDAWILADQQALSKVLGYNVQQQPAPETIKEPKEECERLRDESPSSLRLRKMYKEVLASAEVEVLEKRCPDGFAPFAKRVERLNA
ncbi:MAG: hypothetical protein ACLFV4_04955 [Candidatus Hydrogenedentota bacterium]